MTTPKGSTLNYAKLRNQKRNNSIAEPEKNIDNQYPELDLLPSKGQAQISSFGGSSFMQNNSIASIDNRNLNVNGYIDNQTQSQANLQNVPNKGNFTNSSKYNSGEEQLPTGYSQNNQASSSVVSSQSAQGQSKNENVQQMQEQQTAASRQNLLIHPNHHQQQQHHSQKQSLSLENGNRNSREKQEEKDKQKSSEHDHHESDEQHKHQQKRVLPNDMILDKGNCEYIDQMIKQKKQGEDIVKVKSKSVAAKTAIPSFMKNIHIMQQLQIQQSQLMQQQQQQVHSQQHEKQIHSIQTPPPSQQQQQQQNNDTVRINQKQINPQPQAKTEDIQQNKNQDVTQQIDNNAKESKNDINQQTNQDEKLTQRKTIGSQQPKLFDQFFRNNSYHSTTNQPNAQTSLIPVQATLAQTQRNHPTQQEKIQNVSVLNSQSESKNSSIHSISQIQQQSNQHSNHHSNNQSPSPGTTTHSLNQNSQIASIGNSHSYPHSNKRDQLTQVHLHPPQQTQNHAHHQKKDSSLFNSQQSTLLNNSIGNISPTAQFNNVDSSQFNISYISNIQNVSNNVSSINNQSNIMVNYNSNHPINLSNANSTMSFQKQFDESSPENGRRSLKENNNSQFVNSLSAFIDYFNNPIYEIGQVKQIEQPLNNKELAKENFQLKSQLEQLEEQLKETETSRKILINDLSKIKNRDNEYKKRIQLAVKENSDLKAYIQSINYKLHHTQEQLAKEKIEHENTKFTLKKVFQSRNMNTENQHIQNKIDNLIRPQKSTNQPQRKTFSQQFTNNDNRMSQANTKLAVASIPMQQYQKAFPYAYQNLNASQSPYSNGKQIPQNVIGSHLYGNNNMNNNTPTAQNNIMANQHSNIYEGEQTAVSRLIDHEDKLNDPIFANQNNDLHFANQNDPIFVNQNNPAFANQNGHMYAHQNEQLFGNQSKPSKFLNKMIQQGQDIPLIMDRYNEPVFGGQNNQMNEFEELECKDFNLDDSNQNVDGNNNELYQENTNIVERDDYTDNTTDIINVNNLPVPMQSLSSTNGGNRVSSHYKQQKYGSNDMHNQMNYKQQMNNNQNQDEDYDEEDEDEEEDMNLSDNFNLETDNQFNDDIAMMNIQNKGMNQYELQSPALQSDGVVSSSANNQYYDNKSKIFNTYDNSNFKYSTHRDMTEQNLKNNNQFSYKKGASSLNEDHLYQMMKLQHNNPNQYEMNRLNLNLKAQANVNSVSNPAQIKSQLKQQQINPQNRSAQGGRTMSLSYQKPHFQSQQIQQGLLSQNLKQKNYQQQQQQYLQHQYVNYQ